MSHLLLFDPYVGGHHAEHIRHVLQGWQAHYGADAGQHHVTVAVAPDLLTRHPDLKVLAEEIGPSVRFVEIEEVETLGGSLLATGLWHRHVLGKLIEHLRPTHVFLLYLDHTQLALALGLRFAFPVEISGLLFRPSFHYGRFETTTASLREWATRLRKRLMLQAALHNPCLATVFTLDPMAVPAIKALSPGASVVALPDPVDSTALRSEDDLAEVRATYGVESGRTLALLFGALDERKGVFAVLEALCLLPEKSARRLAVLFAGAARPEVRDRLHKAVASTDSTAQVLLHDAFVPDDEIQDLVRASDLVLVPYQRHVGSSGVLIRAAAAGRPVLGQAYGLVGQQIAAHRLGRAVDSTRPEAIAAALEGFLASPDEGFDPEAARSFTEANTIGAYQRILFDHLNLGA